MNGKSLAQIYKCRYCAVAINVIRRQFIGRLKFLRALQNDQGLLAHRAVDPYGTGGTRPPNIWTGGT